MTKTCRVSFRDREGIEHSCEVEATSVYEAAGLAMGRFHKMDDFTATPRAEITIEAREPSVAHTITRQKFDSWLTHPGLGRPFEMAARWRVREALGIPHP